VKVATENCSSEKQSEQCPPHINTERHGDEGEHKEKQTSRKQDQTEDSVALFLSANINGASPEMFG
jgi:hypothetical protein